MSSGAKKNHIFASGPHIMGVINVTPDSFSDGGQFYNQNKAIDHGLRLLDEGALILDVGGESTRPGSQPIEIQEEIKRVVPVIKGLKGRARHISIDTRNAETMKAALDAGATTINDISGLEYDLASLDVVSEAQVPVFIMHSQGTPDMMQDNPNYFNVLDEIYSFFDQKIKQLKTHRIDKNLVILDPGIGFGKTLEHNMLILRNIRKFQDFGVPILLGTSRKSFIAKASKGEPPDERLAGSLSSALWGYSQGVDIFRVHDVKETVQAFQIWDAISGDVERAE